MLIRHARLAAAVLGVSVSAFAFAQSAQNGTGANNGAGTAQSGSTSTQDPSAGVGGTGTGTAGSSAQPGSAGTGSGDGMGNAANTQTREMQRGQMGGADADAKLSAQLDKIASMPDKAADALFVLDSAKGNMFEVEFARLAQTKAQDSRIKELARTIEQDHSQALQRLQPIAQKMGLELPRSLPSDKQKVLAIYQSMPVQDFETCYLLENKAAHAKDITSYTDHQKSVKDEDLRRYVSETLPKLKQHGAHVQEAAAGKGFEGKIAGGDHAHHGSSEGSAERDRTDAPGVTNQSPDPRNPSNQQNPSDR